MDGTDYPLYPSKIKIGVADGDEKYTDLSMCRLRGSSYIHLVSHFVSLCLHPYHKKQREEERCFCAAF